MHQIELEANEARQIFRELEQDEQEAQQIAREKRQLQRDKLELQRQKLHQERMKLEQRNQDKQTKLKKTDGTIIASLVISFASFAIMAIFYIVLLLKF